MKTVTLKINGKEVILLPEKAVFIPSDGFLLIADTHFGKSSHFRRHGISVTSKVYQKDLEVLRLLISKYNPDTVIFLGDLFHSDINNETLEFLNKLQFLNTRFVLVPGNHDRWTSRELTEESGIIVTEEILRIGGFSFVHDQGDMDTEEFSFSGHLHPAISMRSGFTRLVSPAFVLSDDGLILPAFSAFTGNKVISQTEKLTFFPVNSNKVWSLS